jgi:hypothetical protein
MNFFKTSTTLILSVSLQVISFCVEARLPESYYTENTHYDNPNEYCFPQGIWNGDLSNSTLKYTLIVPPEDQTKHGDIFLGFRQPSAPDELWLYGFGRDSAGFGTRRTWVQYDEKQVPVQYSRGQILPATTNVRILAKPKDIRQFKGDGEVLVGYGLRKDSVDTSPSDSFKEMLDNNRFIGVWQVDEVNDLQPRHFGNFICVKFTEMTQRVQGPGPDKTRKKQ